VYQDAAGQETWQYPGLLTYEAVGLFYKIYKAKALEPGATVRDYPVVVAWQLSGGPPELGSGSFTMATTVIGIVLVLGVLFFALRKSGKRQTAQIAARPWNRPAPPQRPGRSQEGDDEVIPVDPLLAEAAKQFHKERGTDNGTNDPGKAR
jgi:hypothetical protein